MSLTNILIQTLGGLGLFIFGMKLMSEGLQQVAGEKVKKVLEAVSSNRVIGCITGTGITALIQSSSATTVMLIGFVNAGLMNLNQAVGVILGANIGTTVTAQLIAFKLTDIALPAITIGVALKMFGRRRKHRNIGGVILGFGLLFFGLLTMKHGLGPIRHDPDFVAFFTRFDAGSLGGILLCVGTGAFLTVIVQSSSATVGLTIALASQGLITFPGAAALVLGENIGTTITAELATIGGGYNAHRAARAHTMFNVIGVGLMVLVFPYFVGFVEYVTAWMGAGPVTATVNGEYINTPRYIANGHTLFNVINAGVFLIFLPWLVKAATLLTPSHEEEEEDLFQAPVLEQKFVDNATVALPQVRMEVVRMAEAAMTTLNDVVKCLDSRSLKDLSRWRQREEALDVMQKDITAYLTAIYQGMVSTDQAKEISSLMRMSNNVERIGDSVENVAEIIEEMIENKIDLNDDAKDDIGLISANVTQFLGLVTEGMLGDVPEFMVRAQKLEDEIDLMREEMRQGYIGRLRSGVCTLDPSLLFIDMLSAFEKMGDYCYNIAQSVAGVK